MQFIMNAPITIDAVINQTTCLETRLKGVYGQKKAHQSKKAQIEQSLVHSSKHEKKKNTKAPHQKQIMLTRVVLLQPVQHAEWKLCTDA